MKVHTEHCQRTSIRQEPQVGNAGILSQEREDAFERRFGSLDCRRYVDILELPLQVPGKVLSRNR